MYCVQRFTYLLVQKRLNMTYFKNSHVILMLIASASLREVNSARNINFMYLQYIKLSKKILICVSRNHENRFITESIFLN